jgi:hypothetical protein
MQFARIRRSIKDDIITPLLGMSDVSVVFAVFSAGSSTKKMHTQFNGPEDLLS